MIGLPNCMERNVAGDGRNHILYDFEVDRQPIPAHKFTKPKVKPRLVTEDGNTFLRMYGSIEDKFPVDPWKVTTSRTTVGASVIRSQLPDYSELTKAQYYSAHIRADKDHYDKGSASIFELFQSGYRAPYGSGGFDSKGPVARFLISKDKLVFFVNYDETTKQNIYTHGKWDPNHWYHLEIYAVWSHDPNEGLIEAYVDGKLLARFSGRGTILGPRSYKIPYAKFGLYGKYSTGRIDIDNIETGPWRRRGELPMDSCD